MYIGILPFITITADINPVVIINKQKHNDKNLEGSFKSHIYISTIEYYYYYYYYDFLCIVFLFVLY